MPKGSGITWARSHEAVANSPGANRPPRGRVCANRPFEGEGRRSNCLDSLRTNEVIFNFLAYGARACVKKW